MSAEPLEGLPPRLALLYRAEDCLSAREGRSVWRMRRRSDGEPFVLKLSLEGTEDLAEEYRLLERVSRLLPDAVPAPVDYFREEGTDYLLRSYLPGETLEQYRRRSGGCGAGVCAGIGRKLCGLLEILHDLTPPIIHRDIKPENVVLLPDGGVGLIDFGIARQYKPEQPQDTRRLGTRSTAAPEQYGYAQTDRRTDLYGLGMTLIWLLTGEYDRDSLDRGARVPRRLRRVLRKAVSFAPKDRYQDAAAFSKALSGKRRLLLRGIPAALLAALCLGLWTPGAPETVEFTSQSLEAAVRAALERPRGSVTYEDLKGIRRLAIIGGRPFSPEESFAYRSGCYLDNALQEERGDLTDLSLLARMPGLTELYLCRQEIGDLTPLEGLPLETLALCENRVTDLGPIAGMTELEALYLGGNPITEAGVLAGLSRLRLLNLDGTWEAAVVLESFDFLDSLSLEHLSLRQTLPKDGDWSPLTTQAGLDTLQLGDPPEEALAAANTLAGLRMLSIAPYPETDLTALSGLQDLEVLSLYTALDSLEGVENMPKLLTLALGDSRVTDLTPLMGLDRLSWLHLTNVPVEDFSPLSAMAALEHVQVDGAQAAAVEAACPGHRFRLETND